MLSKLDQIRFLENELAGIIAFLSAPGAAKPGKKKIHDLRVNIKKIMALIEFNKIRGYEAGILSLPRMKYLFRTAGVIRNSQVIISNIQKLDNGQKKILHYHRDIIQQTSKRMSLDIPIHLKMSNDFRDEMRSDKLGTISKEQILLYHGIKSDYIKKIFKEPLNPETLHEGRKQIKHILYIREMIKPPILKMIQFHYQHLDELQNLIGKWHDTAVFLDTARAFKMDKNHKGWKNLVKKKKDQFEEIRAYRSDRNKEIFKS
jgi:CHAD domain-containing protein